MSAALRPGWLLLSEGEPSPYIYEPAKDKWQLFVAREAVAVHLLANAREGDSWCLCFCQVIRRHVDDSSQPSAAFDVLFLCHPRAHEVINHLPELYLASTRCHVMQSGTYLASIARCQALGSEISKTIIARVPRGWLLLGQDAQSPYAYEHAIEDEALDSALKTVALHLRTQHRGGDSWCLCLARAVVRPPPDNKMHYLGTMTGERSRLRRSDGSDI